MGSREFKNILPLSDKAYGTERRENLVKEVLSNSTPFPSPLSYKDIDEEFHRWVTEDLKITFEEKEIPTLDLFSNQRFTEYLQSWQNVDEQRNLMMNFKAITRENNPDKGTINGEFKNIPGDRTYLIQRVDARDKNGRRYFIDYRMKQPFGVDLVYKITLVTNKFELINEFNQIVNEKFKAINCYIRPKGHFISMILDNISDDSEYNIDDRQFYSQAYQITVRGYIIKEDDFVVVEKPFLKITGFDGDEDRSYVEIDEYAPTDCPENEWEYQHLIITIVIDDCTEKIKFKLDSDFYLTHIEYDTDYLASFRLFVNDEEVEERSDLDLYDEDEIKICGLRRRKSNEATVLTFYGYNKNVLVNENEEQETEEEFLDEIED